MLAIVDYGMANLRSVQKAFESVGHAAQIISTPEQVRQADHLVVPGVGAFCDAIALLERTGLAGAITDHARSGRPMLGICLGMQLFMDMGFEDGEHRGLGLIPGQCVRFTVDAPPLSLKVPHMGWNGITWDRPTPLFKGLDQDAHVYFVHSYHVTPTDPGVVGATTEYGGKFVAALWKDNIMATQFHPEKSQEVGARILRNFAECK